MNRIDQIFHRLRQNGSKGLMPFVTAGDPDIQSTGRLLSAMEAAGACICEVGMPFSDPIADGPVIQASMTVALDRGLRVSQVWDMIKTARPHLQMGLVAMVSYSIVHRIGPSTFIQQAAQAGIDGFIFPDLPVEASAQVTQRVADQGLICSLLISPTTPIERAERIASACSGFVYLLSRAGITGERAALPAELPGRIERIRQVTDLPIAVGFGIRDAQQVREVVQVADAAIVGSAIMRRVAQLRQDRSADLVDQVGRFVGELAGGLGG